MQADAPVQRERVASPRLCKQQHRNRELWQQVRDVDVSDHLQQANCGFGRSRPRSNSFNHPSPHRVASAMISDVKFDVRPDCPAPQPSRIRTIDASARATSLALPRLRHPSQSRRTTPAGIHVQDVEQRRQWRRVRPATHRTAQSDRAGASSTTVSRSRTNASKENSETSRSERPVPRSSYRIRRALRGKPR